MPRANPVQRIALQEDAAIVHATDTIIGGLVPIGEYEWMTLVFQYIIGDETALDVWPVFMDKAGGIEPPCQEWTDVGGVETSVPHVQRVTASGVYYKTYDVRGHMNAAIYETAIGGTPTGGLALVVILKGNAGS